jgi:hypothetical protein
MPHDRVMHTVPFVPSLTFFESLIVACILGAMAFFKQPQWLAILWMLAACAFPPVWWFF